MHPLPSPLLTVAASSGSSGTYGGPFTTSGKLGDPTGGTSTYSAAANEISLRSLYVTPAANFSATSIEIDIGSTVTNGAKIKPVIYSDSAGAPGTLLFTGSETTLATADANTTKSLPFGSTQTLAAGTIYWVGAIYNSSFTWKSNGTIGGGTKWKANTYTSGAPATLTSPSTAATRIEMRVVGTVSTGLLGNWDADLIGSAYDVSADEIEFYKVTMPSSGYGTPASIFARLSTTFHAGDKLKAVIYTDSGGPSALFAVGAEYTVGSGDSGAHVEMPFTSPPNLAASTSYWIGIHASAGTTDLAGGSGTTSNAMFKGSLIYASGPPSTITSPSGPTKPPGIYIKFT